MASRYQDQYDWVVLGDHPGALLSGCLAARLGLSVLFLDLFPGHDAVMTEEGQVFDPESNFILGVQKKGVVGDALERMGWEEDDSDLICDLSQDGDVLQVLTPQARIDYRGDFVSLYQDFIRELGQEVGDEVGFLKNFVSLEKKVECYWRRTADRLTVSEAKKDKTDPLDLDALIRSFEKESELRGRIRRSADNDGPGTSEAWLGVYRGLVPGGKDAPTFGEVLHTLAIASSGGRCLGGISNYRKLLRRFAKRLGADVPGTECMRIYVADGRLQGVHVRQHGKMIGARGAILGCALDHAAERIVLSGSSWRRKLRQSPEADSWCFSLALTMNRDGIPPGIGPRSIWQEKGAPSLEIEIARPEDYDVKESSHRLVFLRTSLPFTAESLTVSYQKLVAARMFRKLTEVMPFAEDHLIRIFPDFRGDAEEISEAYGFVAPEMIPENLRQFKGPGLGHQTGVEGLFTASNESYPELGSLGGTQAAFESVAWLAHSSGLAGPLA